MDDKKIIKKYTNGDITVVWQPDACIHSKLCWTGLNEVFNPKARPWVNMDGATTDRIVEQVRKCPSGALSVVFNEEEKKAGGETEVQSESIVEVMENGPLLVYGNVTVKDAAGQEKKHHKMTALCRCGASENKPYCDGTHKKIGFEG